MMLPNHLHGANPFQSVSGARTGKASESLSSARSWSVSESGKRSTFNSKSEFFKPFATIWIQGRASYRSRSSKKIGLTDEEYLIQQILNE